MEISLEDIKKTAKLAKFNITSDEAEVYTKQLSAVLDWVAQLQKVETNVSLGGVRLAGSAPLREDNPHCDEACARDIRAAFNDKDGDNLKVKKVL